MAASRIAAAIEVRVMADAATGGGGRPEEITPSADHLAFVGLEELPAAEETSRS